MDDQGAIEKVSRVVDGFSDNRPKETAPDTSRVYFIAPEHEERARHIGQQLWLPVERAYGIFVCAYSALFGIPTFTDEALARQRDRFSRKRLPLTIRSTSSFILDAFGYDRRTGRERSVLYSPGPVISSNHGTTKTKSRISDAAMVYFGLHLIRGAERDRSMCEADRDWHYDYVAGFFRAGGYRFPDRHEADRFVALVDKELCGENRDLWMNAIHAVSVLSTGQTSLDIASSLPEHSRKRFEQAVSHSQKGGQQ